MSQSPYKDWAIKVLPNTGADMVLQLTATFQSPYYGFPVKVSGDQAQGGSNGMILGVTGANDFTAFKFANNLSVSIPSTGSVTTTFNVALNTPVGNSKSQWQALVAFAKTNGYIPIVLSINANVVINNDGVDRIVDWGSAIAGSEVQKFKTGPDFASILNFA
ncbi:hypothetical protein BGX27_005628 [Mortierella sp. AM989]|nr:hypothetical protein BGX27_005628 [Mortierella sp. AM989]